VGELGARLREAREELELTLDEVEDRTRIRRAFIEALEEERFADLPGDVYARGFIRNYASLLGLDAEELIEAYGRAVRRPEKAMPQVLDEPLHKRRWSPNWRTVLLASLGVAAAAVLIWSIYGYVYVRRGPWPPWAREAVAVQTPSSARETPAQGARVTATPTTEPYDAPTPTRVTSSEAPANPTPTQPPPTSPPKPTDTPVPTATDTPTPSPTPTRAGNIVVEARLIAKTYLDVRVDGERVFVGIPEAGQHQQWTAQEIISLRIGNAGGVRLIVNGVDVGIMGEPQQVIDVQYTLDTLPQG